MTTAFVRLGDVVTAHYGKALKEADRIHAGPHVVFGSSGPVGRHNEALVQHGTIIVGRKGSVGDVTYAPEGGWPIDTAYYLEVRDQNQVDLRYLYWALSRAGLGRRAITTSIPGLNRDELYRTKLALPPLAEQRRIAAVLDKADGVRRQRRESLRLLDEFLRSAFLEMFGDPVRNEKGWDVVHGEDVFADLRYGTSVKCSSDPTDSSRPVLRIPNVINGEILWDDLKFADLPDQEAERLELVPGDVLFVRTNGNPEYIGRCAVFDGSRPALFASYLIRGRVRGDVLYRPEFLKNVVTTPSYRVRLVSESRSTAGNYNISTERLKRLPFIRPPLALQDRFLKLGESVAKERSAMQRSLTEAGRLFDSLAQRAFAGSRSMKAIVKGKPRRR